MLEPDLMPAINVGRWGISKEIANTMEISPQMVKHKKDRHLLTLMIL